MVITRTKEQAEDELQKDMIVSVSYADAIVIALELNPRDFHTINAEGISMKKLKEQIQNKRLEALEVRVTALEL